MKTLKRNKGSLHAKVFLQKPGPKTYLTGSLTLLALVGGLLASPAEAQTVLPSDSALPSSAADTSKPGFLWRVQQVTTSQPTTIARTEAQLAGLLGPNVADPNVQGNADGPGVVPSDPNAPIEFTISSVINENQDDGGSEGNFTPDSEMPGIPGTTGSTDNIAVEVLTWLDLPAGTITMGVNSDDGFQLAIGGANPSDHFAPVVGLFDGGRGFGDSIFTVTVPKAGLYAARLIYFEGGSQSSVEWFTEDAATNKVLINDTANGGIKAYRAVTGNASLAYLSKVSPGINQSGVFPNAPIALELTQGGASIDPATVKLTLDNAPVSATTAKSGNIVSVNYTPSSLFTSGSAHTLSLVYSEGTASRTNNWKFTIANYATLPSSAKVTPDTSKPGFVWNVFANTANQTTSNQKVEDALAGLLKDADGNPLPNNADPSAQGVAIAAGSAPNPANAPIHFEIAGSINLTASSLDDTLNANGNFVPDQQMPGMPEIDGTTDGIAAEIITYIELPAGVVTMGVNSDDGFRTAAGNPQDVFGSILAGEYDAARGSADTIFPIVVQEAGVYAFRTIYENGNGGANIEWFTVKADGTKVLVNDTAHGGLKAYRAQVGGTPPYIKSVSPQPVPRQINQTSRTLSLVIADGSTAVDDNSIALTVNGKPVTVTKDRQGSSVTVTYAPTTLQVPDQKQTAEITFKNAGGSYTRTQDFTFRNLKNLVLPAPLVTENFDSYDEGAVPTGWNAINFTTTITDHDFEDLDDLNSDTYKGWIVVSRDRLSGLKSRIFNVAPGQTLNGADVTVDDLSQGNLLYAESDTRDGDQVQFITSKPFNLSSITNVVMTFSSLYEQNQDNIGAVEYSVDGGTSWLPVVYFLDIADSGGDIKLNPDGTVDAVATLTSPNADTAAWVDNGVQKGDKYGDGILAPITQALGDYIAPRINDDPVIDKRIEVFRLPQASKKADVRLRFSQLGTGSWYFGVDNIAFYEDPAPITTGGGGTATLTIATATGGQLTVSWTGSGTLESADAVTGPWTSAASQSNPQTVSTSGSAKFFRIRQ
jgi:hypothetical protein